MLSKKSVNYCCRFLCKTKDLFVRKISFTNLRKCRILKTFTRTKTRVWMQSNTEMKLTTESATNHAKCVNRAIRTVYTKTYKEVSKKL